MKHYLTALAFMASLSLNTVTMAVPQQNANADSALQADNGAKDEVEAFSDTTTVDTSATTANTHSSHVSYHRSYTFNSLKDLFDFLRSDNLFATGFLGLFLGLLAIFLIFIVAPFAVLALLLYIIFRNRRQQRRPVSQTVTSMPQQPDAPQPATQPKQAKNVDELQSSGIRQTCLGVGLMVFLGYIIGKVGIGVGVLVTCVGVGNLITAYYQRKKEENIEYIDENEM
jgi:hypothetical protein